MLRVVESWTDPATWQHKSRVRYINMIDIDKIKGQLSVLEGLIIEIKDNKLRTKMNAEIIKLKQMLG